MNAPRGRSLAAAAVLAVASVVSLGAAGRAAAQPRAAPEPAKPAPLEFIRIDVPEDFDGIAPPTFGFDFVPLPIKLEEFERLIKAANSTAGEKELPAAHIQSAIFQARLDGDALVGTARLDVQCQQPEPVILSLGRCAMALGEASWEDGRPARIGLGADGQTVLPVERAGVLQLAWSLQGEREASGNLLFPIAMPPTTDGQVNVELPPNLRAVASHGVALEPQPAEASWQRWDIRLGGLRQTRLTVAPATLRDRPSGVLIASQRSEYQIDPSGFQLTAEIGLEARDTAADLRGMTLELDPGIRLVGASLDGEKIEWETRRGEPSQEQEIELQIRHALLPLARSRLVLTAVGAIPLEQPAVLPAVRPSAALWQSGASVLRWDNSLQLEQIDVSGGVLAGVRGAEASGAKASANLQFHEPAGRATVLFSRRKPQIAVRPTYAWRLLSDRAEGRLAAELICTSEGTHEISAELAPGWLLDEDAVRVFALSAADEPPTATVAHRIEPAYEMPAGDARPLRILLDPPLTAGQRVRLEVQATNRQRLPSQSFPLAALQFLRLQGVQMAELTGAIAASSPHSARLHGGPEITYIPLEQLDPGTVAWLSPESSVAVFSTKSGIERLGVQLVRAARRLTASVNVEAMVQAQRLAESYEIRFVPDAAGIDRLRVHFWPPRAAPLEWSFPEHIDAADVSAQRVSPSGSEDADSTRKPEVWELAFRRRQTSPLAIKAARSTRGGADHGTRVALAAVEDATSQTGRCVVKGATAAPLRINSWGTRHVVSAASEPPARTWGTFRYAPSPSLAEGDVGIEIVRLPDAAPPSLAWHLLLESDYSRGEAASHRATWLIHNEGLDGVRLEMPPSAAVHSAAVNGTAAQWVRREGGAYLIGLPPGEPFVRLSVDFTSPREAKRIRERLSPASLEIDIPVLQRSWRAALPRGFAAASDRRLRAQAAENGSLRQQWLGPFAAAAAAAAGTPAPADSTSAAAAIPWTERIELLAAKLAQQETTWGQALLEYQLSPDGEHAAGGLLLIDARAVAAAGIAAETPLASPAAAAPAGRLAQLLETSGLAVVVTRDYMVLTSADFVHAHADQLSRGPAGGVVWVKGRALAEQMSQPLLFSAGLTTPQVWASSLSPASLPWGQGGGPTLAALAHAPGAFELSLPGDGRAEIVIFNVAAFQAFAFAAMLAALAAALWRRSLPLSWVLAAMLGCGAATLLVEQPFAWIGSGAFVGLLLASLLRLVRGAKRRQSGAAGASVAIPAEAAKAIRTACWLPAAFLIAATAAHSRAAAPEKAPVYPVWYRLNEKGQLNGYVDLPRPLLAELEKRAAQAAVPSRQWIMTAAGYRLQMQWHVSEPTLEVQHLQIDYTLDVLDDAAHVLVPLPRGGIELLDDGATLNGSPVEVMWRLGDQAIRVPTSGRGEYRLRLRVRPDVAAGPQGDQFNIAIPPFCGAKLHVLAPRDAPPIELPSCVGRIQHMDAPRPEEVFEPSALSMAADLGPADRLRVRWPHRPPEDQRLSAFDTQELYWLRFDQDGARLEVQIRATLHEGAIRQVTLETNGKAVLPVGASAAEAAAASPTQWRRFQLSASPAGQGKTLAKAAFRLADIPAAGRLILPQFRVTGAGERRLLFAVSPPHNVQTEAPMGLSSIDPAAFLQEWGPAGEAPPRAFEWSPDSPAASLVLSPKVQPRPARQTLHYGLSHRTAEVQLRVEVDAVEEASAGLRYAIDVPRRLNVESVHVVSLEDSEMPAEDAAAWWAHRGGTLSVFLKRAMPGKHEVVVQGTQPLAQSGRVRLGAFKLRDADVQRADIFVHRHDDVLVELAQDGGYLEQPAEAARHQRWGRLAAHLRSPAEGAADLRPVLARVLPNEPKVGGVQLTRLARDGAAWNVIVDLHLEVRQDPDADVPAAVDALEFQLPADIAQDLYFDPKIQHHVLPAQEPALRRVVVVPPAPIHEAFRLRMTAYDIIPAGQEVRVPDIRPVDWAEVDRFVAVPRSFESQSIVWDTPNRQPVSMPKALEPMAADLRETHIYPVQEEPFRVALRSLRSFAGVPLVRLADIRFAWDGAGRCYGMATYDLEPAGLSSCQVEVPAGVDILEVRVADLPAEAERRSPQRWRVKLADHNLPQRVEVLYGGRCPPDRSGRSIEAVAPRLAGVTIERTAWSVWAPAWLGPGSSNAGGDLHPVQQDLMRLRSLTELIRLPSLHRLEHSTREMRDWIGPWQARWQRRRGDVIRGELLAGALTAGEYPRVDLSAVDQAYAQTIDDLAISADANPALNLARETGELWEASAPPQSLVTRRMLTGASPSLAVTYDPPRGRPGWWQRMLLFTGLIAAALLAATCRYWLPPSDWTLRSGHALGVLVGLFWALSVWPSAVGWAIVALSLIALAWRPRFPAAGDSRSDIIVHAAMEADGE